MRFTAGNRKKATTRKAKTKAPSSKGQYCFTSTNLKMWIKAQKWNRRKQLWLKESRNSRIDNKLPGVDLFLGVASRPGEGPRQAPDLGSRHPLMQNTPLFHHLHLKLQFSGEKTMFYKAKPPATQGSWWWPSCRPPPRWQLGLQLRRRPPAKFRFLFSFGFDFVPVHPWSTQ